MEKRRDRLNQTFQICPTRRRYCKIIGIANIIFYMEYVLHKLIKLVYVDICKKLRREVADGDSLARRGIYSLSLSLSLSVGVV